MTHFFGEAAVPGSLVLRLVDRAGTLDGLPLSHVLTLFFDD